MSAATSVGVYTIRIRVPCILTSSLIPLQAIGLLNPSLFWEDSTLLRVSGSSDVNYYPCRVLLLYIRWTHQSTR